MSLTRDMMPEWELRKALDTAEAEVERWKGAHAFCEERIDNCAKELTALRALNAELVQALRWAVERLDTLAQQNDRVDRIHALLTRAEDR